MSVTSSPCVESTELQTKALCRIAVVIPSYRVTAHIAGVIARIGPEVERIYVVDDKCPDNSGDYVEASVHDARVRVLRHEANQGVGGAVITGYRAAIADGADVIVKIDGDGQMDPGLIPAFVTPILSGEADYTKGNRFFDLDAIQQMPTARIIGNAALSFLNKLSSGYWNIFDPTNGYTAIHADVARHLPLDKISRRYFFESDMLFRLNSIRAVVIDIPMDAVYGNEISHLKISRVLFSFAFRHLTNLGKRILYNYFLRDMSIASVHLLAGIVLSVFGIAFGATQWIRLSSGGFVASAGTVMLSALPIFLGIQLLLSFLSYDFSSVPTRPRQKALRPTLPRIIVGSANEQSPPT